MRYLIVATLLCGSLVGAAFAQQVPNDVLQAPEGALPRKLNCDAVPNPVQVHANVISGGLPVGRAGFKQLADWGVRTIISVDGAKPDVETAKKFGMRYVHLPHGYDGIPADRARQLAKAVRELPGPIYVHCHHGKHRSPAAASVACVTAGLVPPADAVAILKLAGTSDGYRGLYQSARAAAPVKANELDQLDVTFREVVEVPPMAEAMVDIGHIHDHLKAIANAGWRTPDDHPDLDPAHTTLMLREQFTELLRTEEVQSQPAAFQQMLRRSEADAEALREMLTQWKPQTTEAKPPSRLSQLAGRISDQCKACHVRFRDVPLTEK